MTDPELGFEDFVAAGWAPLYRTAYLLCGTSHEAEDLLQTALATTCVRWGQIRDKGAADAYVRRTMLNLAGLLVGHTVVWWCCGDAVVMAC